jgi:signal transduction histidine kinase
VTFVIDDALPSLVADAGRLELVLINLLANAVKYSDPVKPVRLVRVEHDAAAPYPRVRVRDNGIGIPPSKLAVIFDQFVRVHAHLDDELGAQGMGLGLSIVRECMEAMGGSIRVESIEGAETTFTLEWPTVPLSALSRVL